MTICNEEGSHQAIQASAALDEWTNHTMSNVSSRHLYKHQAADVTSGSPPLIADQPAITKSTGGHDLLPKPCHQNTVPITTGLKIRWQQWNFILAVISAKRPTGFCNQEANDR